MTKDQRHDFILTTLAEKGDVTVAALAAECGVDLVTIRRDLAELEERGVLRRVRGGATASRGGQVAFAFAQAQQTHTRAKKAIAVAVARRLQPGMSVSLDTGTTTLAVARQLARTPNLRVLTSSLAIASVLYPHDNIELVLLGGMARRGSPDLFGALTEENVRGFRVNLAILGADAVSPDGLFTTDACIARVSQAMIAGADEAILVADSSKFGRSAFVRFAGWDKIAWVVTDDRIAPDARAWLQKAAGSVEFSATETP